MPNRTVLNKYGLFVSQIHKVQRKREITKEDFEIINKARLIAMLCSSHSWQTFGYFHGGRDFNKEAIVGEINAAYNERWKDVSESDIKEVVNTEIDKHAFSIILLCFLDKSNRKEYTELLPWLQEYMEFLPKLKEEFIDGMEPIENREMR